MITMLLQTTIIVLIAVVGVIHSQDLGIYESWDSTNDVNLEYRPWIHGDASTIWISLQEMGITTVTSMFQLNIPNLRWLVLDNNRIDTIRSLAFAHLPDLTYISLANNQISQFEPNAFENLEKLQVLDLDGNPVIGNLNCDTLSQLSALKLLYLRNCGISFLDLPECMKSLSRLYLSNNQLRMFYARNGSALTHLYLNNNALFFVPLSQMTSLIHLNLQSNQIKRIQRRSHILINYYIEMARRQNYYGQDDAAALYLDDAVALQNLIVSSNQISRIDPDTFVETKALVNIDLTGNKISEVYADTFNDLLVLERILLDSNKIGTINRRAFVNLPNLRIISLKNNLISDLDEDAFTKLNSTANEVYLFLDNNKIHTLRRGSFRGIQGLKHIGLSGNRIKIISSQAFVDLPNLGSIVIEYQSPDQSSHNYPYRTTTTTTEMTWPLRGLSRQGLIESDAFFNLSNLASITIRENSFTEIEPRAFHNLPKLITLDLSNNSIETVSSEAFFDLPVIENLYLGGNLMSTIARDTFPTPLKHLDLSWNPVCSDLSCWHIEELLQLDELDVSGIIDRLKVEDYSVFPKNLTVIFGKAVATSNSPVRCY